MADVAKLNVVCSDIQALLEGGLEPLAEHSVNAMNGMINKKQYGDFLDLVESFGESMAFVNHNDLCTLLLKGWTINADIINNERKATKKKHQALMEDKKADPESIAKNEELLVAVSQRRAMATAAVIRLKAMTAIGIEEFKKNPHLDAVSLYSEKK